MPEWMGAFTEVEPLLQSGPPLLIGLGRALVLPESSLLTQSLRLVALVLIASGALTAQTGYPVPALAQFDGLVRLGALPNDSTQEFYI